MADSPITPEEKLLRIIESPPQAVRGMRRSSQKIDFKLNLKLFRAKYGDKLSAILNLKSACAVLIFLSGLASLYFIIDFWLGSPRLASVQRLVLAAKKTDIGDLSIGQLDPLSLYLQEITQRNIFALPEVQQEAVVKKAEPAVDLKNLVGSLKVVGIIWSEAPQAIIEDPKEGKTYLLNRGSKVKDARVKDILKDRVILSYDSQEVELR